MVDGDPAGTEIRKPVINVPNGKSKKKNVGFHIKTEQREKAQTSRLTSLIAESIWVWSQYQVQV